MTHSNELSEVYRQAIYVAFLEGREWVLRVGETNPLFVHWLKKERVSNWGWITAANPFSSRLREEENQIRNKRLQDDIESQGYRFRLGEGRSPKGDWPVEKSFLILDISEAELLYLGLKYQQAAVLMGVASGEVRLRFL
jgi:Protein of unknown function (DUF3293)